MASELEKSRILKIVDVLSRAAEGEYTARLDFASKGDPLGSVADAINTLLEKTDTKVSEISQSAEGLALDSHRYRNILHSLEETYFETDLKGRLLFFNGRALKDLGYTQEELEGLHFHDLVDEVNAGKVYKAFHDVFVKGRPNKGFEWEILKKNKEIIEVESSVALLRDEKGEPAGFRGVVRDISRRKQAERDLHRKEEKYRNILENMADTYLETDLQGSFTFFNDSLCRILGYPREELQGLNYRLVNPPEHVRDVFKAFNEIYTTGRGKSFLEHELITRDGASVFLDFSMSPLQSRTGEPIGFSGFGRDVTERVKARRKIEASERQLRLITDNISDIIWTMDFDLRLTHLSLSTLRITGFTPEELMSVPLKAMVSPEMYDGFQWLLADELNKEQKKTLRESARPITVEVPFRRKDGSVLWAEINITFNRDENGRPFEIVGVTRDISERKQAEEQLRESEERYRMIAEKMTDIVWMADMDLRTTYVTPSVQAVLGFTPEERMLQTVDQQFPPESLAYGMDAFARELALEEEGKRDPDRKATLVLEYYHKDGSTRWMETVMSGIRDDQGVLTGLYGLSRDITDRRRIEEELRESEKRYRIIVENVNDIVWTIGLDLQFIYVSPSNVRVSGYTREEVMTMSLSDMVTPESLELATRVLSEELALETSGKPFDPNRSRTLELEICRKDGAHAWLEADATFNHNADGTPKEILAVGRDITERKRAEQALRESEALYRTALETTNDGVSIVQDNKYVYANQRLLNTLGRPDENLIGTPNGRFVHPDDWADIVAAYTNRPKGAPVPSNYDVRIFKPDGSIIHAHIVAAKIIYQGKPSVLSFIVDVTQRKQAEEQLRESEKKYRTILDEMGDGYWEVDLGGKYIFFNGALSKIHGFPPEKLMKMTFREYTAPETAERISKLCNQVYRTGKTLKIADHEIIREDGSKGTVEFNVSLMKDGEGRPVGFRGITRDVTKRKKVEIALAESERRYRMIMENMHDIIWTMDLDFNYTYRSPANIQITGYTPEEITGIPAKDQITPESYALVEKALAEELEKEFGQGPVDLHRSRMLELEVYHKDGGTVWIEVTATFIRDDSGKPVEILLTARDITGRKRAEEEKDKLEKQLVQAQKMETVGRLAGGVAHDFNNMLSVILGYVDLAKLRLAKEHPVLKDIVEIEKAALRSRDITTQLLAFSRKQIIVPKIIDLNDLIAHTQRALTRLIGEDIEMRVLPGEDLWAVKFDPSQIEQVLINLAVNARDAMYGGGKLTIETRNIVLDDFYCENHVGFIPGRYVRLSVSDNGVGMDRETMQHIFEPFFTTKEAGKGTGLGLATVYGIVKQNESFINVYSEPGYGTTFNIYVPRTTEARESQKEFKEEPVVTGAGNILLVEDDPMVLEITKGMLEAIGYGVIVAETPLDALSLCEKHGTIDLVITDVVMPAMSGNELRNKLMDIRPDIAVLFMSGYPADAIAHHGVLEEGVHFLQKPFSLKDLAGKVREAMTAD